MVPATQIPNNLVYLPHWTGSLTRIPLWTIQLVYKILPLTMKWPTEVWGKAAIENNLYHTSTPLAYHESSEKSRGEVFQVDRNQALLRIRGYLTGVPTI